MNRSLSDKLFDLERQLETLEKAGRRCSWRRIHILRVLKKAEIWEQRDCDSWAAYLARPELDYRMSTIDGYIRCLDLLEAASLDFNEDILNLSISKAKIIAPHITEENAYELLAKAEALSCSSLVNEIKYPDQLLPPKPLLESEYNEETEKWRVVRIRNFDCLEGLPEYLEALPLDNR